MGKKHVCIQCKCSYKEKLFISKRDKSLTKTCLHCRNKRKERKIARGTDVCISCTKICEDPQFKSCIGCRERFQKLRDNHAKNNLCRCGRERKDGRSLCHKCTNARQKFETNHMLNGLCKCGKELYKNTKRCKKCIDNMQKHNRKVKTYIYNYKVGKQCDMCKEDVPSFLLEYDHCTGDKSKNVCHCSSISDFKKEVIKTRLLCVICHRLHTKSQRPRIKNRHGHRYKNRLFIEKMKSDAGCSHCNFKDEDNPNLFEYDHIDPTIKVSNITTICDTRDSLEEILSEIAKCQLLCIACHRIKTVLQFDSHYSYIEDVRDEVEMEWFMRTNMYEK